MHDSPTLTIGTDGFSATVSADRFDSDAGSRYSIGWWSYRYNVVVDGAEILAGDDLRSGAVAQDTAPDLPGMLSTLLAFLADGADHGRPGRPAEYGTDDLPFPVDVCKALHMVGSDELHMLREYLASEDD